MEGKEKTIDYQITDEKIAVVKLNRVKKMNAMTFEMFKELDEVLTYILSQKVKEVRAIVLTHNGKNFTSGLDIQSAAMIMKQDQQQDENTDVARVALDIQSNVGLL